MSFSSLVLSLMERVWCGLWCLLFSHRFGWSVGCGFLLYSSPLFCYPFSTGCVFYHEIMSIHATENQFKKSNIPLSNQLIVELCTFNHSSMFPRKTELMQHPRMLIHDLNLREVENTHIFVSLKVGLTKTVHLRMHRTISRSTRDTSLQPPYFL